MGTTFKVVMFGTSDIHQYTQLSAEINRRYCQQHGYAFAYEQYDGVALAPQHEKVRLLYRHLGSADYIMWIDADACFINFDQTLRDFTTGGHDLITAGYEKGFDPLGNHVHYQLGNIPCGLNGGVLLLRSSQWSYTFLEHWWNRCLRPEIQLGRLPIGGGQAGAFHSGPTANGSVGAGNCCRDPFNEQGQLQQMLMSNELGIQERIGLITPSSRLNRGHNGQQDACDFILHLWGSSDTFRAEVFQTVLAGRRPEIQISLPHFNVPMGMSAHPVQSPPKPCNIFVDGGTHSGEGLTEFFRRGLIDESFTVHAFEPNPACDLSSLAQLPLTIHLHRAALWIDDTDLPFQQEVYQAAGNPTDSADQFDGQGSAVVGNGYRHPFMETSQPPAAVQVRGINFSRFLSELPRDARILCKLDIEGSEFMVLRHLLEQGTSSRIAELYCEFHERFMPLESTQSQQSLVQSLESAGTKVHLWY